MKRLAILGSTGSIGRDVLDVIRQFPGHYSVVGLAAGRNTALLMEQIRYFRPEVAAVLSPELAASLKEATNLLSIIILHGKDGYKAVATHPQVDLVVSAMVGAAGLIPTLAALEAGKAVALANKETLVTAGPLVTSIAREKGVTLLPIDSEHSAIFQSLQGHRREDVRRLVLTASGGPFWSRSDEELTSVTPEEALRHPNWSMGAKISIDSATLMNKGLEVIEARWLFDVPVDRIDVLVHRQSIVHSMVEYIDGSVVAQMGIPDMRVPIAYALAFPARIPLTLPSLDLVRSGPLTFEAPPRDRFPCLALAYEAARRGGTLPTALNAANEVAVEAFLEGRIGFLAIPKVIEGVLEDFPSGDIHTLDDVVAADAFARLRAEACIHGLESGG